MSGWLDAPYAAPRIGPAGWLRVGFRGAVIGAITYGGLLLLLVLRLIERPLFGRARPWTPYITQAVCKSAFVVLGLTLTIHGKPMQQNGAVVANHSSWLDIFALNACQRITFVAKSEVRNWVAIGWLARATGTVFIARKGSEAKLQAAGFEARLKDGHKLLFFPEGTSTDALRVLPFKSSLFAAFFAPEICDVAHVQPVTVIYHAPPGQDARYYGWWGEMEFAPSLVQTLAGHPQGLVEVIFHPEVPVTAFEGRKALAAYCERVIRASHSLAAS